MNIALLQLRTLNDPQSIMVASLGGQRLHLTWGCFQFQARPFCAQTTTRPFSNSQKAADMKRLNNAWIVLKDLTEQRPQRMSIKPVQVDLFRWTLIILSASTNNTITHKVSDRQHKNCYLAMGLWCDSSFQDSKSTNLLSCLRWLCVLYLYLALAVDKAPRQQTINVCTDHTQ